MEELICSQEDQPGEHYSYREIADALPASKSSVQRMVKRKGYRAYKRLSTPQMSKGCRKRSLERSASLADRFSENSLRRLIFQDEKDFSLQVLTNRQNNRVYSSGPKAEIIPERLYHEGNRFSKKVMVSAILSWKGASKPFFVGGSSLKTNGKSYLKHLKNDLLPSMKNLYPNNDFTFIQDSAPSHRAKTVQDFLKEELRRRFVPNTEWPPTSPDCNPLDYYFWNDVKERVYMDRHGKPFESEEELKEKICQVWDAAVGDIKNIRKAIKQFLPRLRAVVEKDGGSIKTLFG